MLQNPWRNYLYKLTIIIPVLNNTKYTKNCVEKLTLLNDDDFEIIIVDNGSNDGTADYLRAITNKNVKTVLNKSNTGFGFACNQGYQASSGKNILFLNNDIKFSNSYQEWFSQLNELITSDELVSPSGGFIDKNFNFKYETQLPTKEFNYLSGWCLAGSRETFNKLILSDCVGPFDSISFFVYYEDTDLSFRASKLNIKLKLIQCPLIHFGKQTSSKMNLSEMYLTSKTKFCEKWKQ